MRIDREDRWERRQERREAKQERKAEKHETKAAKKAERAGKAGKKNRANKPSKEKRLKRIQDKIAKAKNPRKAARWQKKLDRALARMGKGGGGCNGAQGGAQGGGGGCNGPGCKLPPNRGAIPPTNQTPPVSDPPTPNLSSIRNAWFDYGAKVA